MGPSWDSANPRSTFTSGRGVAPLYGSEARRSGQLFSVHWTASLHQVAVSAGFRRGSSLILKSTESTVWEMALEMTLEGEMNATNPSNV